MSRRYIDQIQRERILEEKIQVYDEAYKLGYQSGREHNEHKIDSAYDLMKQALETLKELTEESADDYIDAIVPCRDCKHHRIVSDDIGDYPKCELHNGIWWLDDFCSKGERKESEENKKERKDEPAEATVASLLCNDCTRYWYCDWSEGDSLDCPHYKPREPEKEESKE